MAFKGLVLNAVVPNGYIAVVHDCAKADMLLKRVRLHRAPLRSVPIRQLPLHHRIDGLRLRIRRLPLYAKDGSSIQFGKRIAGFGRQNQKTVAPLLLIPLCIMPIIETLSDIIQVAYFKLSHGKRVFKMAPFHHHLEMGGWTGRKWKEIEIFVLFAGITLVMAGVALLGVTGRYSC